MTDKQNPTGQEPIAIVGIGALFPGSVDQHSFWKNIVAGTDLMGEVPPGHWLLEDYYDPDPAKPGKTYTERGAFLPRVPFDPIANRIPPANLPQTDSAQLLALVVAKQVLEDACGGDFQHIDREQTSVILGVASTTELVTSMAGSLQQPVWLKAMRNAGLSEQQIQAVTERTAACYTPWTESTFPGLLGNVVAGRVASRFDLGGANCVIDAACASSLAALRMAMQELWMGGCDLAITGGVDAFNDIFMYMCFSKTPAMSARGECRPFSDDADGTLLGEGVGMLALRRLADAERDGDRIYAVLKGIGASSDGRAKSIYAPRAEGQARALRRAYQNAGYSPATVELVEAHGTGTAAGDSAEVEALKTVFREAEQGRGNWCALGSVKSQIGHTKAAAGAASLIKTALALHHKILPPTININAPNPVLQLEHSPFYLNTRARPWIRGKRHPRRASVSSFGFGGSNYHITLEEYTGPAPRPARSRGFAKELFLFSANDPQALLQTLRRSTEQAAGDGAFAACARESQVSFDHQAQYRLAIVAAHADQLNDRLTRVAAVIDETPRQALAMPGLYYRFEPVQGKLALLFPGQGSQKLNMGAEVLMAFDAARAPWDRIADNTDPRLRGLTEIVFPPPAFSDRERQRQQQRITDTRHAQPALAVTTLAYLALAQSAGIQGDLLAGHSFGELSALYAAGVLSEQDYLSLAAERGALMGKAAAEMPGAMLAVFAGLQQIEELDAVQDRRVVVANHNTPAQCVLAGPVTDIEHLERLLAAQGTGCKRLNVSTAFHSPIVEPAVQPFQRCLEGVEFATAQRPVYSNTLAAPYPDSAAAMRACLAQQLAKPVHFVEQIDALYQAGARCFVEIGPGGVLSELTGHCLAGRPHLAVALDGGGVWNALGALAVAGLPLRFDFAWQGYTSGAAQPQRHSPVTVQINGANYAKPYPPASGDLPESAGKTPAKPPVCAPRPDQPINPPGETPKAMDDSKTPTPAATPQANPQHVTQPAAAPMPDSWYATVESVMRHATQAHQTAQQAMADAHIAYLRASEAALARLQGGVPAESGIPAAAPRPALSAPVPAPAQPVQHIPAPAPLPPVTVPEPPPPQTAVSSPITEPEPTPVPAPAAQPAAQTPDLNQLVLGIVAEKTGYPADMLKPDMELEADLGIDSIKRVEILSAVQEAAPDLPELDVRELASLATLDSILQRLGGPQTAAVEPESDAASAPPTEKKTLESGIFAAALRRMIPQAVVTPPLGLNHTAPLRSVAIAGEDTELAYALGEALRDRGIQASALNNGVQDFDALVFLGTRPGADPTAAALQAFSAAREFVPRAEQGAYFMTVQDTGGDFGHSGSSAERAWLGGLTGLARTAAQEWPASRIKAIDIDRNGASPEEVASRLSREIMADGAEREIALPAREGRLILTDMAAPIPAAGDDYLASLPERPVLLVSGGARGVTAACLQALAAQLPVRLALLGRSRLNEESPQTAAAGDEAALKQALLQEAGVIGQTPSPRELDRHTRAIQAAREVRGTLGALESIGAEVIYLEVDVSDAAAVAAAAARVRRRWGRIDGLIHGAGQLADKRIADKTPEQFERVFRTKVEGLRALLAATETDALRLLVLFSSVAGRYGNAGQVDYAMANEVLNRVAQAEAARRGPSCLVRAINWGPWAGGMVTPALQKLFEQRGIGTIGLEQGAQAFVAELRHADPAGREVEVIIGNHLAAAAAESVIGH